MHGIYVYVYVADQSVWKYACYDLCLYTTTVHQFISILRLPSFLKTLFLHFYDYLIGPVQSPVNNSCCTFHRPCAHPGPSTRHFRQINQSRNGRDWSHRGSELWSVSQSRYYVDEADSQAERVKTWNWRCNLFVQKICGDLTYTVYLVAAIILRANYLFCSACLKNKSSCFVVFTESSLLLQLTRGTKKKHKHKLNKATLKLDYL